MTEDKTALPAGWDSESLGSLGTWSGGGTPSKANRSFWEGGTIPWVSPKDMKSERIQSSEDLITEAAVEGSSAKYIEPNSVLMVTRSGILAHTFPVAVTERVVTVNQDLKALTPHDGVEADFLAWYLRSQNSRILTDCAKHGTTVASIDTDRLHKVRVPIAPLEEQRRIVEKIETLFTELDKGEESLRQVQTLLARYRQSVLKAAVTGELTADWRAERAGKLEHGSDLLERILQTRRDSWKGRGKYKNPALPDLKDPPALPEGWVWGSLDALIEEGPSNGVSPKETNDPSGVLSFKLTATTSGKFLINEDTIKRVGIQLEEDSQYWLKANDVLIQRGNTIDYVGTAAIFPGPDQTYIYPDLMMRIRLAEPVLAQWAVTWINFEYAKRHFRRLATGTAGNMPKINATTLRSLPVPLPSMDEIRRVLAILHGHEQGVDATLQLASDGQIRSRALRQSILKDAFSGRLVPQDPNDEPASELLARIRQSRAADKEAPRRNS